MENQQSDRKKVILSGIQPSGKLHIGNLAGAIRIWAALQDEYDCYFTIVDLHAITIRQEPAELRKATLELAAMLIACGLNPEKCTIFIQSHVPEHSQLAWILNCYTPIGELSRMTQFKDKSQTHADNINAGLFTYPVLQAADILLYQADMVPVGNDQKQHLELSRNIAERFNNAYSPTFVVPEPYIPPVGARIMNLQEPTKKMSKSDDNDKATIYLSDSDEQIRNKIKRSVTDSGSEIIYNEEKAGVANLMSLYSLATGKSFQEIELEFKGKGYGDFKSDVGDAVAQYINPIRTRFEKISKDKAYLEKVLSEGAEKAHRTALKTLRKVYKKIGLIQF
ncbi:MAG: tryptophan--tRNA ligase [bacterium]